MYGYMYVRANIIIIRISIQEKKTTSCILTIFLSFFYNVLEDITVIDNFDIHICFISTYTIKHAVTSKYRKLYSIQNSNFVSI